MSKQEIRKSKLAPLRFKRNGSRLDLISGLIHTSKLYRPCRAGRCLVLEADLFAPFQMSLTVLCYRRLYKMCVRVCMYVCMPRKVTVNSQKHTFFGVCIHSSAVSFQGQHSIWVTCVIVSQTVTDKADIDIANK